MGVISTLKNVGYCFDFPTWIISSVRVFPAAAFPVAPERPAAPLWSLSNIPSTTDRSSGRKRASRFCTTTLSALPMLLWGQTFKEKMRQNAHRQYVFIQLSSNLQCWQSFQTLLSHDATFWYHVFSSILHDDKTKPFFVVFFCVVYDYWQALTFNCT